MNLNLATLITAALLTALSASAMAASAENQRERQWRSKGKSLNVQVGPRPYYLVEDMEPGPLKTLLQECSEKPFKKTDFSIGHRGDSLVCSGNCRAATHSTRIMIASPYSLMAKGPFVFYRRVPSKPAANTNKLNDKGFDETAYVFLNAPTRRLILFAEV